MIKDNASKGLENNDFVSTLVAMVFLCSIKEISPEVEINKALKNLQAKAIELEKEDKVSSLAEFI